MSRTVHIFVCGIRTLPGSVHNWTGKAVTWSHVRRGVFAEKVEYFTPAILRPFGQKKRMEKLKRTLSYYFKNGFEVVLSGHSNGCDVILDALHSMSADLAMPMFPIKQLNMISPACSADADVNGMNDLIAWLPSVDVYIAEKDMAMMLAGSRIGRLLGFGTMGRDGILNAAFKYREHRERFGHSDWFRGTQFEKMMVKLLREDASSSRVVD